MRALPIQHSLGIEADLSAAKGRLKRSEILLQSNPELELSTLRGKVRTNPVVDPGLEGPLLGEKQTLSGYEIGLSQQLETGGQRGLRMEESAHEIAGLTATRELRMREVYFGIQRELASLAAHLQMTALLDEHILGVSAVETLYRNGAIRDARLGMFVLDSIRSDIAIMRIERSGFELDRLTSLANLRELVPGQSKFTVPVDPRTFPSPPDESLVRSRMNDENPLVKANIAAVKQSHASLELAGRRIYPDVTVFLGMGEDRRGRGYTIAAPPLTSGPQAERERYFRLGVRVPIPVFNRGQGLEEEARSDLAKASILDSTTRNKLEAQALAILGRYAQLRHNIKDISGQIAGRRAIFARLSAAVQSGRMGYTEFWSEQSKWITLERDLYRAVLGCIQARADLEILTGLDLATGSPVNLEVRQ